VSCFLQYGMPADGMDALLFYLERCWAAAEAGEKLGPAATPPPPPLGLEQSTWLLELLCGLASAGCLGLGRRGGAAFLPRAAAEMLMLLPFLSEKHTSEDLHYHARKLASAGPEKLHALWRRLGVATHVAARRLAAAAAAGPAGEAAALLGRLALATGALLASLAVAANSAAAEAGQLPAEVPGALYAALEAAASAVPSLQLHALLEAKRVGDLVGGLAAAASVQGTAVLQASRQRLRCSWNCFAVCVWAGRRCLGVLAVKRRWTVPQPALPPSRSSPSPSCAPLTASSVAAPPLPLPTSR
jgi:hypothetical protein